MEIILTSTFSLGMLDNADNAKLNVKKITIDDARNLLLNNTWSHGIGHPATKQVIQDLLGIELAEVDPKNRVKVVLTRTNTLVVFQLLHGSRLPEGHILNDEQLQELVNNDRVAFYQVSIESKSKKRR
ncbi:MAG: DUF1874 domain-containing protein [Candidatus Parvarchaeum sp.]